MTEIRLNKKNKTIKIVNRKDTIRLQHTGKAGPVGPVGPQGPVGVVDRNLDGGFANSIYGGTSGFDGGNA